MAGLIKAAAVALILNGQPSGNVLQASYNGHHADVQTKVVQRHIPRGALQQWRLSGGKLTITTDQLFGGGFDAQNGFARAQNGRAAR